MACTKQHGLLLLRRWFSIVPHISAGQSLLEQAAVNGSLFSGISSQDTCVANILGTQTQCVLWEWRAQFCLWSTLGGTGRAVLLAACNLTSGLSEPKGTPCGQSPADLLCIHSPEAWEHEAQAACCAVDHKVLGLWPEMMVQHTHLC